MEGHDLFSEDGQFETVSQHVLSADTSTKRGTQNRILAMAGKLPTRSVHKTEEQIRNGQAQCPFCKENKDDDQEHFFKCTGNAIPALANELWDLRRGHHLAMIANMHKWEIPGMDRPDIPPLPAIPWADKIHNSSNIAARRATLQEKDTEREANLGEDLRQQVVEFADKSEVRADKERSRWREALDRDLQLRIPHAKFRLLLKAEKEKKKLEKKRQEDKEKAEANGEQPDPSPATATSPQLASPWFPQRYVLS